MKKVKVFAPATVANVNCGFDVLGFSMVQPADEVVLNFRDQKGIVITSITGDGGKLSADPARNTAGVAIQSLLKAVGSEQGFEIQIKKNLPLGSGMGSSAASAVAAVVGVNFLLGEPLSRKELVPHVMVSEEMACGSAHADNAAPGLLGGFVLVRDYHPLDIISIPLAAELFCTLVHPHIELKTEDARRVMKGTVALRDAVTQSGNLAAFMIGLMKADYELISKSMRDVIAEPTRSAFIPGFSEIRKEVIAAGGLGFGISGSGPTVFVLSRDNPTANKTGSVASEHFRKIGLPSDVFISRIDKSGARIEELA